MELSELEKLILAQSKISGGHAKMHKETLKLIKRYRWSTVFLWYFSILSVFEGFVILILIT